MMGQNLAALFSLPYSRCLILAVSRLGFDASVPILHHYPRAHLLAQK